MKAWYFSGNDRRLRHGDGREIALGVTHEIDGEPELCKNGLHGSIDILDALGYAPGTIVWRVELSGMMDKGDDKIAAQRRKYVAGGIDISDILRKFARMCALDVMYLWDAPEIVVRYLKTGNHELRSAVEYAARDAARAAALSAVWDAAQDAALSAALFAAQDAALFAALDAAVSAAQAAAWSAARSAVEYAARDAARSAAWDAVRKKQSRRLLRMVNKAIRKMS